MARLPPRKRSMLFEEWFWNQFAPNGDCLDWTRGRSGTGYGLVSINGDPLGVHVVAWMLTHGLVPAGMHICHTCDRRICGNVAHLFLGTPADNARDAARKGRKPKGAAHAMATLTASDVLAILDYARTHSQRRTADQFGVTQGTVSHIVTGRQWSSVTGRVHEPSRTNRLR